MASSRPRIATSDPTPALPCSCWIACVMMSRAAPGAVSSWTFSSTLSVVDFPVSPRIDTSASSAGNSASTP